MRRRGQDHAFVRGDVVAVRMRDEGPIAPAARIEPEINGGKVNRARIADRCSKHGALWYHERVFSDSRFGEMSCSGGLFLAWQRVVTETARKQRGERVYSKYQPLGGT